MRYAARKDDNHAEIVNGLRAVGVKVLVLNQANVPDLLVAAPGLGLLLMEIKDGAKSPSRRKLRPGQAAFMDEWAGYPICKVESLQDAFVVLGIKAK